MGKRSINRREFVRTTGGILVSASLGQACTESGAPGSGIVHVTIGGLAPGFSSAGFARITGNGIVPIEVELLGESTGEASVRAGTYQVDYDPPSGYIMAQGSEDQIEVTVRAGAVTPITFQVVQTTAPAGVIFHSDFGTALGTSDAAVMDTGKQTPWNVRGGQGLEVIPATGLDFPTANVLRVTALTANSGFGLVRREGMPVPSVGQSRFYRWYIRAGANIEDGNTHPIQDGFNAGASNWQFEQLHTIGGTGKWTVQFKMGPQNAFNQNFRGPALDVNVTYRFEVHLVRVSNTTYNFHVRVYNSSSPTTPIFSDTDFNNVDAAMGIADLAAQPNGHFTFNDVNNLHGLNGGCNGVAPLSSDRVYGYQSGFAVGGSDWLGPYGGGI
jgi:hypothetical protein